ncbi:hypothetical protein FGO68_gene1222 [Halteria grandinella]|uniref:Uncharacterized protein n=1 Tax=Halteria grandinella TaxID=5974 RepID=A0A8J8NQV8_HALGN|nr:hypothetical protein FGO68_gene1222 [Halteria grandinella]
MSNRIKHPFRFKKTSPSTSPVQNSKPFSNWGLKFHLTEEESGDEEVKTQPIITSEQKPQENQEPKQTDKDALDKYIAECLPQVCEDVQVNKRSLCDIFESMQDEFSILVTVQTMWQLIPAKQLRVKQIIEERKKQYEEAIRLEEERAKKEEEQIEGDEEIACKEEPIEFEISKAIALQDFANFQKEYAFAKNGSKNIIGQKRVNTQRDALFSQSSIKNDKKQKNLFEIVKQCTQPEEIIQSDQDDETMKPELTHENIALNTQETKGKCEQFLKQQSKLRQKKLFEEEKEPEEEIDQSLSFSIANISNLGFVKQKRAKRTK